MTIDARLLAAGMTDAVPFARTLGIEFVDVTVDGDLIGAEVLLPDDERLHNHVAGPHAGAIFTLGETASGAVVLAAFGERIDHCTPLAVNADIAFRKLIRGPVRARARLGRPVADVLAELDAGTRPEFPVHVELLREDGAVAAEMRVTWTLRPL